MTTAQPGQEQRMETVEQIISAWAFAHDIDGAVRNDLFDRLRRTRPTADLGEDGELVELADKAERWAVDLMLDAMRGGPNEHDDSRAKLAAQAETFFNCAAAIRSRHTRMKGQG